MWQECAQEKVKAASETVSTAVKAVRWDATLHCSLNEVMLSAPVYLTPWFGCKQLYISKALTFVLFLTFTATSFTADLLKTIFFLMSSHTPPFFLRNFQLQTKKKKEDETEK